MTDRGLLSTPPGSLLEAQYEGFWTRLLCGNCGEVFDVEGDVSTGEPVECDACGTEQVVVGR